ncbi:MAG: peptide chain release factor 2 [Dehalococcoidia bacterium]|nr:peptide chain release factor 2 [Dehalococcoidia bacterium]
MDEFLRRLADLRERFDDVRGRLDLPDIEARLLPLKQQAQAPDLWNDQHGAQRVLQEIARLEKTLTTWGDLEREIGDLEGLIELAGEAPDNERPAIEKDIDGELAGLEGRFGDLELELTLGGQYDRRHAVLAVHAGAGGTEAQDWAEMLLRMYLRWAEQRKLKAEILSITSGEEAGIKSAELRIVGDYAYGLLRSERGVHRLVRISPFDASASRHTSFALVEVMPEVNTEDAIIEVNPDDLRIDTYRASGHGGQNVQKNDTAVRITHLPTNIVVTCQNERSQGRNRESAMLVLKSKLLELELERREAERLKLRGAHVEAGWGNQIRSYVLQPYKMVKDLRTSEETSDTTRVLDGGLDPFIQAYLRSQVGQAAIEAQAEEAGTK